MADDEKQATSRVSVFLRLGILVLVVIVGGIGGFATGRHFVGSQEDEQADVQEDAGESDDFIYYDFEPIVVTLNVPRKDRYVRATITLAIGDKDQQAAVALLEKRKPVLKDKLITYLSGLTLDDVADSKSLEKIRREILDSFNQLLWPDERPLVDHLLFKEFALQ